MSFEFPMKSPILVRVDADLSDLAPVYLEKRIKDLSQVVQFIHAAEFHKIEEIGHMMKGNASLFGLDFIAENAALLENFANLKNVAKILEISELMLRFLQCVQFEVN